MEEIRVVEGLEGQVLNLCKTMLAYEVTAQTHGKEEALKAYEAASSVFGRRSLPEDLLPSSTIPRSVRDEMQGIPSTVLPAERLEAGIAAFELFTETGLCESKSAARRLIQQGGAYVNDERIEAFDKSIGMKHVTGEGILLKAGKKKIHRILVKE
jgi:tyrosyl-tRNA synthetase